MSASHSQAGDAAGHPPSRAAEIFDARAFAVRLAEARRRRAAVLAHRAAAAATAHSVPETAATRRQSSVGVALASGFVLAVLLVAAGFHIASAPGPGPQVPDTAPAALAQHRIPLPPALPGAPALSASPRPAALRLPASDALPLPAALRPRPRPGDLPRLGLRPRATHAVPAATADRDPVGRAIGSFFGRLRQIVGPGSPRRR